MSASVLMSHGATDSQGGVVSGVNQSTAKQLTFPVSFSDNPSLVLCGWRGAATTAAYMTHSNRTATSADIYGNINGGDWIAAGH